MHLLIPSNDNYAPQETKDAWRKTRFSKETLRQDTI